MQLITTSGRTTSDAQIIQSRAALDGIFIETDGSAGVTVTLHDTAVRSTSAKIIRKLTVAGSSNYGGLLANGIRAENGIYVVFSSTGAGAYWIDYHTIF